MTCAASSKGTTGMFAAKRLLAFLREIGAEKTDVIMKSDGEAAIKALMENVVALRPATRTIREEAPRGSCASNGVVERAIQSERQQAKVLKMSLEDRWGKDVVDEHPVMVQLVEYSAVVLNRREMSKDGATA